MSQENYNLHPFSPDTQESTQLSHGYENSSSTVNHQTGSNNRMLHRLSSTSNSSVDMSHSSRVPILPKANCHDDDYDIGVRISHDDGDAPGKPLPWYNSKKKSLKRFMNKGDITAGLFGFAGGITNWLAVKMLFDRIPFLYGSGVIPRQFVVIRQTVKDTIMENFFDASYLETYMKERSQILLHTINFEKKIKDFFQHPQADAILNQKLTEMAAKPEGVMLATLAGMFGGIEPMIPMIKPMLTIFAKECVNMLKDHFNPTEYVCVETVQTEIDHVMTEKLKLLSADRVKELMEHVIREHLGWLVIWGNIFGAVIGVVSLAVGYG